MTNANGLAFFMNGGEHMNDEDGLAGLARWRSSATPDWYSGSNSSLAYNGSNPEFLAQQRHQDYFDNHLCPRDSHKAALVVATWDLRQLWIFGSNIPEDVQKAKKEEDCKGKPDKDKLNASLRTRTDLSVSHDRQQLSSAFARLHLRNKVVLNIDLHVQPGMNCVFDQPIRNCDVDHRAIKNDRPEHSMVHLIYEVAWTLYGHATINKALLGPDIKAHATITSPALPDITVFIGTSLALKLIQRNDWKFIQELTMLT
ncbi:hypothetical protein CEK25_012545 [Fusarium fujikuroi]|nr:hypothetical protein CEK25_012545 [Fusarium fujikuroi]